MSRLEEISNQAKARLSQKGEGEKSGAVILELPNRRMPYKAFDAPTNDPQIRLIVYARQMFLMPRYDVLYDVVFSGRYDFIGLVFPHQRVKVYGRNLSDLVFALRLNCVEWIREYVETHHELPADKAAAVITEIEVEGASMNPFGQDMPGDGPGK